MNRNLRDAAFLCHFQIACVVKRQLPHTGVVKIAGGLVMHIKTGLEFFFDIASVFMGY